MADVTDKSSLPFPELPDVPNVPDDIEDLAASLDSLVIPKYANSTARNAANPSPANGDMCFQTDVGPYGAHLRYNTSRSAWKLTAQTLLYENILSSPTTSVTISGISGAGTHLQLIVSLQTSNPGFSANAYVRINSVSSASYNVSWVDRDATAAALSDSFNNTSTEFNCFQACGASYQNEAFSNGELFIANYAVSGQTVQMRASSSATDGGASSFSRDMSGAVLASATTTPVTSITITETSAFNLVAGSGIWLYALP